MCLEFNQLFRTPSRGYPLNPQTGKDGQLFSEEDVRKAFSVELSEFNRLKIAIIAKIETQAQLDTLLAAIEECRKSLGKCGK